VKKKCYTMGKNTASGGSGGGLKKNVFGTFMNVFCIQGVTGGTEQTSGECSLC